MKFLILPCLFLLFGLRSFAQSTDENFESALFPKKGGAEVVYSSDEHSITLDIASDSVKTLDKPGLIIVDNKTLQFAFIPNEALKTNDTTQSTQQNMLLGYMQYELDYAKNDLKLNYTNLTHEWININGKLFLLWYYDMPAKYKTVLKQINLSTICFAHALNLNTPLEKNDDFNIDKDLLLKIARTFKQNNYKIDFDELYKKLHGQ